MSDIRLLHMGVAQALLCNRMKASDVEIRAGLGTHGLHRHCQRRGPRRIVREILERAARASNFYGYGCTAVWDLHLAAPAHLETCVSRASHRYRSGVAWHDSRF